MESSDKTKHMCYICQTDYNVYDKKPKLLPCLHCVCESCYRSSRTNKKLQHCPQCHEISARQAESQVDWVTVNHMVTQTLKEAVGDENIKSACLMDTVDQMVAVDQNLKDASSYVNSKSENLSKTTSDTNHGRQISNDSEVTHGNNGRNKVGVRTGLDHEEHNNVDSNDIQRTENTDPNWFDKLFHLNQMRDDSTEQDTQLDSTLNKQSPDISCVNEKQKGTYSNVETPVDIPVKHQCSTSINKLHDNGFNKITNDVVCSGSLSQMAKGIICSSKRHTEQAVCYCPDCHMFLCLECQTNHADDVLTIHHRYCDIDVLCKIPLSDLETNPHCVVHPEYPLIYFCYHETCNTLACVKCATNLHNNHEKTGVDEATAQKRASLKELVQQIDETLLQMADETRKINKTTNQDKMFQTLLETIEKRKGELLSDVDKYYANNDVTIAHLTDLMHTKYYCDMALAYATKSELLQVSHMIRSRADEQLSTKLEADDVPKEDLIFVNEDQMNMVHTIESLISGLSIGSSEKRKLLNRKHGVEESFC